MADNDYLCVYRQFFEEFAKMSQEEGQFLNSRPMRVNSYDLSIDELVGEVMQTCVNYLIEGKCPGSLVVPLTKIVIEEFINEAKKQPEEVYTPLKLMKETHQKISEVCLRYTDNEKLSSLPGPVQETYYSTHSTKHLRSRMEDRLICLPRFNTLHNIQSNSEAGYYGIFDGHSGVHAACYAVSHLHQYLAESRYYPDDPVQAFREAFKKTDCKYNSKGQNSGTTVLVVLHQPVERKLTVAWVGDSQAMLVDENSYVMLINPHKPERIDERKRIEALGGCVICSHNIFRVNGGLAVSRAIGDKKLKPFVSAEPEIRVLSLTGNEHFIVMGCDGLWDVVEPQQVIETVYFEVKKNEGQIDLLGRRLVDLAKKNNSTDNISVIVIFLTDPAEIINRTVDVTGHRPKILLQDGVIMDANFQTNDKSPFSDPGMNGIYETNGNHFNNHMQNESDEDFGPETDVDAVDDILTSPKNLNPFAKDCWQKAAEENSDELIELPDNLGLKFEEDFTESSKTVEDIHSSQISSSEINSDKFPIDSMNPFETSFTNKTSEESNNLCNFADDNNKYLEEIHSRKEEKEDFTPSNTTDQSFDLKQVANLLGKPQEINPDQDLFSFDSNGVTDIRRTDSCTIVDDSNTCFNEGSKSNVEEGVEKVASESPVQKESASEFSSEFDMKEISSNENNGLQSSEINTTLNKMDEFRDLTFKTKEEAVDLIPQGAPLDASGYPPVLCSVIDIVEAEKASCDFSSMEKSVASKGDEPSSELLSPSAPALDGELKDDTVIESGGEVEDSEDEEWNYIKVESGVRQTVPIDNETCDLVSNFNKQSEVEKATMNSPLNPEADEFIPVSAMSTNDEYNTNMTPKKAIPNDLTDIIASSPNWNNMNEVRLPEESAFLNEIKSRPSNIFENIESSQQEDSNEKANDINTNLSFISPEKNKENDFAVLSQVEPHGLDLASDMTSSFIDPSTMSPEIEIIKEQPELMNSQIKEFDTKNKELFLDEKDSEIQEPANVEVPSKLPDVLSPAVVEEVVVPSHVDEVKSCPTEVPAPVPESVSLESSHPSVLELEESKFAEANQASTPSNDKQVIEKPQTLSEAYEKSSVEEEANQTMSPKSAEVAESVALAAGAAAAAVAVGAATTIGVVDTKKDSKKSTPRSTSTSVSKTQNASKPLLNGTAKGSTMTKKSTPSTQPAKTLFTGKTTGTATASATKTSAPKTTNTSKPLSKTTPSVSSTLGKAPARPRSTSTATNASKSSPTAKTTVTISPTKPMTVTTTTTTSLKSTTRTPGSASSSTTLKAKPRISSATFEKKTTSSVNGETKSTVKRTEVITKRTSSSSTTTTATTGATRTLSARTTTGPPKPVALKTTVTTTRTVTTKPRTTPSTITATSTLASASKPSPTSRKSTVGVDKQAKEVANRLTSKATSVLKANGIAPRNTTTTVTKTRKTLTTTTTTTPTKTKNHDKTENKAEKILEEKVEIIQSENGAPLIENINNTGINLIDNIISE